MKKIIVLSLALCVSGVMYAADVPVSTESAPAQSYHSTTDASVAQPVVTPVVSTSDSDNSPALINSTNSQTQSLQWQQQTDQHLQNLDTSNQSIGNAIQAINQNILVLQQQIMQLTSTPKNTTFNGMTYLEKYKKPIIYATIGMAFILLALGILIGRLFGNRKPTTIAQNAFHSQTRTVGDVLADDNRNKSTSDRVIAASEANSKSEYDFMDTREAIPAKLDLARSYIAMGDVEQAKNVLKIVLEKGNEALRLEAKFLLNKLNMDSSKPENQTT